MLLPAVCRKYDGLAYLALPACELALLLAAETPCRGPNSARRTWAGMTHVRTRMVSTSELAPADLAAAELLRLATTGREARAAERADVRTTVARHAHAHTARRAWSRVAWKRTRMAAGARHTARARARVRRRQPRRARVGHAPAEAAICARERGAARLAARTAPLASAWFAASGPGSSDVRDGFGRPCAHALEVEGRPANMSGRIDSFAALVGCERGQRGTGPGGLSGMDAAEANRTIRVRWRAEGVDERGRKVSLG
jgi:hypothetical protein